MTKSTVWAIIGTGIGVMLIISVVMLRGNYQNGTGAVAPQPPPVAPPPVTFTPANAIELIKRFLNGEIECDDLPAEVTITDKRGRFTAGVTYNLDCEAEEYFIPHQYINLPFPQFIKVLENLSTPPTPPTLPILQ